MAIRYFTLIDGRLSSGKYSKRTTLHPIKAMRLLNTLLSTTLLGLAAAITCQHASADWLLSQPGWNHSFPADHSNHPGFKTEWWYFTGNLRNDSGDEFGYQLTFFRQGVLDPSRTVPEGSRFIQRDMKFAHFAVSSITEKKFHHFQKVSRGAFSEAGFDKGSTITWIDDWSCERTGLHSFRLKASSENILVDLQINSSAPPLLHGENGLSRKSAGEGRASHYYSLTRMNTIGTLSLNGAAHHVRGLTWFDHEWATNQLDSHQAGWDWFSLQCDDGSDLMLFQIRTTNGGRDPFSSGTWTDASGNQVHIREEDFFLEPVEWWTSPKTKAQYPVSWKIRIPGLGIDLLIAARFPSQELAIEPIAYWEGAVAAKGMKDNQPLRAKGYLEMTGYAGRIVGMQAP
jgi:predicted secreted hydrolase